MPWKTLLPFYLLHPDSDAWLAMYFLADLGESIWTVVSVKTEYQ